MPKTKGDACRLIDNFLGKKHKSPTLKLHRPRDVNLIVDQAAERARRQLEDQTPHYRRTPSDRAATSHLRLVGMDWPDASDESGMRIRQSCSNCEGHRDAGQTEANEDTYRGEDAAEVRARPARNDFGDTQVNYPRP